MILPCTLVNRYVPMSHVDSERIELLMQSSVVVIIPALNEEVGIASVLEDLPQVERVYVVDNGSIDRTAEVAKGAGAIVVHEPRRGYGNACLAGLAALEASIEAGKTSPEVIAFVDADHSDSPERLPQLVTPILLDKQDLVIGSRMLGKREPGAMPPVAIFGNHLASWLMRTFWGASFTDLGPFRAIRYESLKQLGMADRDFGWTIEMQLKALQHKLRVIEVPVPYRNRIGTSKISGTITGSVRAGSKILYCLAKHGLVRTRKTSHDP